MLGTLERDFVVALTEMMDGQLANIQMKKQRSPLLCENSRPQVFRFRVILKKVQAGKDQEKVQSEKRLPLQKPRWEKTKLTIRYLYHENIS